MIGVSVSVSVGSTTSRGVVAPSAINNIVIEGDSITSNLPSTPNGSYGYQYDAFRADKTVEVRAQGSRVIGAIAELNDNGNSLVGNLSEDIAYGADLITFMIGANDLGLGNASTYRTNLINLYAAYKSAKSTLKIGWSPPTFLNPTGTPNPNKANFDAQRADILSTCRDPAVWGQWADYYIPMGEIPDFGDAAVAAPLFGDNVHPSAAGQDLLYAVYKPVLETILDSSRAAATSPYDEVWPVNETNLEVSTPIVRRFILSGLQPNAAHNLSVTGAARLRRNVNTGSGTSSLTACYNGDTIDLLMPVSATNNTPVTYDLTIGSETRTISLTTVAAVTPVTYVHGGMVTDAANSGNITLTGLAFEAGLAVLSIASKNATALTVNGVAGTKLIDQPGSFNPRLQVWSCPVAASGSYNVVITGSGDRTVVSYGTVKDADATPTITSSSCPGSMSAPHATASHTVPSSGLMLGFLIEYGGASVTPTTGATSPSVFIDERNVTQQGETAGLTLAKRTSTGTVEFDYPTFGSLARGAVVFKAFGT